MNWINPDVYIKLLQRHYFNSMSTNLNAYNTVRIEAQNAHAIIIIIIIIYSGKTLNYKN